MLSFFKDEKNGRNFWNPQPTTGNYEADYEAGKKLAMEFIQKLQKRDITPFILSNIIESFPPKHTPIEQGFLAKISYTAM